MIDLIIKDDLEQSTDNFDLNDEQKIFYSYKQLRSKMRHVVLASLENKNLLHLTISSESDLTLVIDMIPFFKEVRLDFTETGEQNPNLLPLLVKVYPEKASTLKRLAMLRRPLLPLINSTTYDRPTFPPTTHDHICDGRR